MTLRKYVLKTSFTCMCVDASNAWRLMRPGHQPLKSLLLHKALYNKLSYKYCTFLYVSDGLPFGRDNVYSASNPKART